MLFTAPVVAADQPCRHMCFEKSFLELLFGTIDAEESNDFSKKEAFDSYTDKLIKLLREASKHEEDSAAMEALGHYYLGQYGIDDEGLGPMDEAKALYYFRKAAQYEQPGAQLILSWAYAEGKMGLTKDESQSQYWLRKAAKTGSGSAQYILARMYADDFTEKEEEFVVDVEAWEATPKDLAKSYGWLILARRQSIGEATEYDFTPHLEAMTSEQIEEGIQFAKRNCASSEYIQQHVNLANKFSSAQLDTRTPRAPEPEIFHPRSAADRLRELNIIYMEELISEDDYNSKRQAILDAL